MRTDSLALLMTSTLAGLCCVALTGCDSSPEETQMRRADFDGDGRDTFEEMGTGEVLEDVDVLDGGMLDEGGLEGGSDDSGGAEDEFVWQALRSADNFHRVHYSDYGDHDVSKVFKNQESSERMIVYSYHDENEPGMHLVIAGNDGSPRALKPGSAHEDLACLSATISCQGDPDRNILLFQREGEACHPLIQRLPNDYFVDKWLKLADECVATGLLGEASVGNGFYFPFQVAFQPDGMQAYATTWAIGAGSFGAPEINPQYAELAFEEPVSAIRAVPSASRGLDPDSPVHKITVQAFAEGGGFSTINPGEHRIQADCGGGFEDIRSLNEIGRYRDETLAFPDAVGEHEADMVLIENCDIRVGYRP